ncbi:unnamed protein product [Durusdinium trenchii]|uniref:ATPase dynein-related AAA domain-containing protein n=1 Tax=Durusdinium trenchii TaxID=1381693 RepID=A0ABP0NR67_9DINO
MTALTDDRVRQGDIVKVANGKTGFDAVHFLNSLYDINERKCPNLKMQLLRFIAPKKPKLKIDPPSCCTEVRPLLQDLVGSLTTFGRKLVQFRGAGAAPSDPFWDIPRTPVASHQEFNLSETSKSILGTILKCSVLGMPLLIEGEASAGKTVAVEYAAHIMQKELLKFPVSPSTSIDDIIGSVSFSEGTGTMQFKPGVLPQAMSRGYWLLLDEANLAPPSVLSVLEEVFNTGQLEIPANLVSADARLKHQINARGTLVVTKHPAFCIFATQNPPRASQYRATRPVSLETATRNVFGRIRASFLFCRRINSNYIVVTHFQPIQHELGQLTASLFL